MTMRNLDACQSDRPFFTGRDSVSRERVRRAVLKLHELPCLLPVVRKAINTLNDPGCTNHRLEQILLADPSVVACLLRLANSAYFGVSRQVSTVSMAITLIGHERLRTVLRHILVAEIFELLSAHGSASWAIRRLAAAAGAACRKIAEICRVGDPDELLAVGLLHNVGELVLLAEFGERFLETRDPAEPNSWASAQLAAFAVESGEAGQWLLDGWNFPPIFGAACAHWRDPFSSPVEDSLRTRLALVHAAAAIARCWLLDGEDRPLSASIPHQVLHRLRLTPARAAEISEGFEKELKQTLAFQGSLIA